MLDIKQHLLGECALFVIMMYFLFPCMQNLKPNIFMNTRSGGIPKRSTYPKLICNRGRLKGYGSPCPCRHNWWSNKTCLDSPACSVKPFRGFFGPKPLGFDPDQECYCNSHNQSHSKQYCVSYILREDRFQWRWGSIHIFKFKASFIARGFIPSNKTE